MPSVRIQPATPQRRDDIAAVMNDCGDASHRWCAFWSRPRRDFNRGWGEGNRRWFMARIDSAPRSDHERLARSRNLAAVDELPVWSITCLVMAKRFRRQGLMRSLIDGAVALARANGAEWVEAYPLDPQRKMGSDELYTGLLSVFEPAGFRGTCAVVQ